MKSALYIVVGLLFTSSVYGQFPYYAPGTNASGTWTQYAGAADRYYGRSNNDYYEPPSYNTYSERSAGYRVVYGSAGYDSLDLRNEYSQYGSPYSSRSWRNPYTSSAPRLYTQDGEYRGRLSTNEYDSDSISNPYGRYGSRYSSESINNPYSYGNDRLIVVPEE